MLSQDIQKMYTRWKDKALAYDEKQLADSFDKFFTLFVAYNILYTETTKILVSRGQAKLNKYGGVPDAEGATTNIITYLGKTSTALFQDSTIQTAINELKVVIPNKFYIKDLAWDRKRMDKINSGKFNITVTKALLELIYGVRCNMFHGNKEFKPIQIEILNPCIKILEKINEILFEQLKTNP